MKLKHVLFLFLGILLISSCQKDKQKLIVGEWQIKEARVENMDKYLNELKEKYQFTDKDLQREKERVQALPTSFYPQGITMKFDADGKYYLGGIEGKWTYNPDNDQIKIQLAILDTTTFIIKKITRKELVLIYPYKVSDVDLNFELVLTRVKAEEDNQE